MIDEIELGHGNYYLFSCTDEDSSVDYHEVIGQVIISESTKAFFVQFQKMLFSFRSNEIKPIALDQPILERCDFTKINGKWVVNKRVDICHIVLASTKDGAFTVTLTGPFGMVQLCQCKYLHQVQNIYRSIVGEILKLKDDENNNNL